MALIKAETVFCHDQVHLRQRQSTIKLHDQKLIRVANHFTDTLRVIRGLLPNDVAIFFTVTPSKDDLKRGRFDPLSLSFGYLVAEAGLKAGQGMIVSGDACDNDPDKYVTPYMQKSWELLASEGYGPEEFSLHGLANYFENLRLTKAD